MAHNGRHARTHRTSFNLAPRRLTSASSSVSMCRNSHETLNGDTHYAGRTGEGLAFEEFAVHQTSPLTARWSATTRPHHAQKIASTLRNERHSASIDSPTEPSIRPSIHPSRPPKSSESYYSICCHHCWLPLPPAGNQLRKPSHTRQMSTLHASTHGTTHVRSYQS